MPTLSVVSLAVLFVTLTPGFLPWYYKNVSIEVVDGVTLTIKDTIESVVGIITDIHAPVHRSHVNVISECDMHSFCVILGSSGIHVVAEKDEII